MDNNTTIFDLPASKEAVAVEPLGRIVELVLKLGSPNVHIHGDAALKVNTFLAFAALRMAECIQQETLPEKVWEYDTASQRYED